MLKKIKNELQEIAETIKAVVGIDVTIMNKELERIAGTGRFEEKIGLYAPRHSVFETCISTKKQYFLDNPTKCYECRNCEAINECNEKAEVCFPIVIDDEVEGVIGMIIFNNEQKKNFLIKKDSYKNFDKRVGELISSRIKEKNMNAKLEYKSKELLTVIDSVNEGIIIIDKNNKIVCFNKYIKNKLDINEYKDLINKNIKQILPKNIFNKILKTKYCLQEEGSILIGKTKEYFLLSVTPIILKGRIEGAVFTFKDFNKLQRSILKINEKFDGFTFDNIIGSSSKFLCVKEQAKYIAKQDIPILLLGESGTGKELFARAIHVESNRKNEIFMPINCGAIPENLLESELFGYEKGAFTGANSKGKMGKFEIAKDGTLFLDEIGDLPLHMQVKLLRALETKKIVRVGGLTPIKVNCRIIAATNKDLYEMVNKGEFRRDLFYRLNVIPIQIPSLKERGSDIFEFCEYFLKIYNNIYKKKIKGFTEEAKNFMLQYSWPGNIRELQNLIEYAINFQRGEFITIETISKKIPYEKVIANKDLGLKEMILKYQKNIIKEFIKEYGESTEAKKKIANRLKISTATLYRKLEE